MNNTNHKGLAIASIALGIDPMTDNFME
jgi:hypothetical protein